MYDKSLVLVSKGVITTQYRRTTATKIENM